MTDTVARSISLEVNLPGGSDLHQSVLDSIRRYRAAARQVFSALTLAQMAGAEIEDHAEKGLRVLPDNDAAKTILDAAMGKSGKALAYECREWVLRDLLPDALSFVWDSMRREVSSRWNAPDPEFPRATRGYLTLQGARGVAQLNRIGIGFPQATARPKLEAHAVTLKWDRTLEAVTFQVGTLDPGRYRIWRAIVDGEIEAGTVYLNERDGRLRVVVTYAVKETETDVDSARVLRVKFDPERADNCLRVVGPDGKATYSSMSAARAVMGLRRMKQEQAAIMARKEACGNPKRPWGNRNGWRAEVDCLARLTRKRTKFVENENHAWSRNIADRAEKWRCGQVVLELPEGELFGEPWNWSQLREMVTYKIRAIGGVVTGGPTAHSPATSPG